MRNTLPHAPQIDSLGALIHAREVAILPARWYNNDMGKNFRHNRPRKQRDEYTPVGDEKALSTPLGELGLSERTAELLAKGGVATARDLAARRMREMYRIQNIGKKQCFEVKGALTKLGLDFRPDDEQPAQGQGEKPVRDARPESKRDRRQSEQAQSGAKRDEKRQGGERGKDRKDSRDDRRDKNDRRDGKGKQQRNERDPYAGMSLYEIVYGKREPAPVVEKPQREPLPPDAIVKFNRKGKWGYRDRKGNVVIQPDYDDAFEFSEDLACVERDGKLGYIDKKGDVVIDFKFDSATSFSDGLASVTVGEKSGYIDKHGEEAVSLRFDVATPFEDGRAIVREDGRWGVLDRKTLEVLWR